MATPADTPSFLTPELMEQQGQALRRLAVRLLGDEDQAADVVQETWLTAMQSPPQHGGLLAWLRVVTHNISLSKLRSQERRKRREAATAQSEALESTEAVVARGDVFRTVSDSVMALPEPYRSTLLLRYYEGHESHVVAKMQGISPVTVRSRIHRGLKMLRSQLDADDEWGNQRWKKALAPLVGLEVMQSTAGSAWAAWRSVGSVLAHCSGAAVLITLGWVGWNALQAHRTPEPLRVEADNAAVVQSAEPAGENALPERRPLAAVPPTDVTPRVSVVDAATPRYRARGRVVDAWQRPVPRARVLLDASFRRGDAPRSVWADAEGRFEVSSSQPIRGLSAVHPRLGRSSELPVVMQAGQPLDCELVVSVPGSLADVALVDLAGQPIEGALVRIGNAASGLGVRGREDRTAGNVPSAYATSGPDGRASLVGIPDGTHVVVVMKAGFAPLSTRVSFPRRVLRLALERGITVQGRATDGAGLPMSDVVIKMSPADPLHRVRTITDQDGRYVLSGLPAERVRLVATREATSRFDEVRFERQLQESILDWDPVLRQGSTVRFRLEDPSGQPVVGWTAILRWEPTDASAEDAWKFRFYRSREVVTDEDGRVELAYPQEGVRTRVEVRGLHAHWPVVAGPFELDSSATSDRVLVVDPNAVRPTSGTVRLVDHQDQPVAVTKLWMCPADSADVVWTEVPLSLDATGEVSFAPMPSGTYRVAFAGADQGVWELQPWVLTPDGALVEQALPVPGTLELSSMEMDAEVFDLRLEGGPSRAVARSVAVQDGRGVATLLPGTYHVTRQGKRGVVLGTIHVYAGERASLRLPDAP